MTRCLVIFLVISIVASILPDCYLTSLFRFGDMLGHYHQHLHEADGGEQAFLDFFSEYLSCHTDHTEDASEPGEHPIQHRHGHQCFCSLPLISVPAPTCLCSLPEMTSGPLTVVPQPWASSTYLDDIWQPPRA